MSAAKKRAIADETLGAADPFTPGGGELIGQRFRTLMKSLFEDPEVQQLLG